MGLSDIVQVVLGSFVLVFGLLVLFGVRQDVRQANGQTTGEASGRAPRGSVPTRYLLALVILMLGYHLVVWSFPVALTPLQLPRDRWWLVLGLGIVVVILSVGLDRSTRLDHSRGADE